MVIRYPSKLNWIRETIIKWLNDTGFEVKELDPWTILVPRENFIVKLETRTLEGDRFKSGGRDFKSHRDKVYKLRKRRVMLVIVPINTEGIYAQWMDKLVIPPTEQKRDYQIDSFEVGEKRIKELFLGYKFDRQLFLWE